MQQDPKSLRTALALPATSAGLVSASFEHFRDVTDPVFRPRHALAMSRRRNWSISAGVPLFHLISRRVSRISNFSSLLLRSSSCASGELFVLFFKLGAVAAVAEDPPASAKADGTSPHFCCFYC